VDADRDFREDLERDFLRYPSGSIISISLMVNKMRKDHRD